MLSTATMTASDLWALSQGTRNEGNEECHWCASPCNADWLHDEPPPLPFTRAPRFALRSNNLHICRGCWLWRRRRVTVRFLDDSMKDGQSATNYSWLIWHDDARVLKPPCYHLLWAYLLKPPTPFCLALIDGEGIKNLLQFSIANNPENPKADTPLQFTLNNAPQTYTVYELQEAIKTGKAAGKNPGVQTLLRLFGKPDVVKKAEEEKRGRGRPVNQTDDGKVTKQPVKSGS